MGACLTCFRGRASSGGKDIDDSPRSQGYGNRDTGGQKTRLLNKEEIDSSASSSVSSNNSKRYRIVKGKKRIWSGASVLKGSQHGATVANESGLDSVDENSALLQHEPHIRKHEESVKTASQSQQSSFVSSLSSATTGKNRERRGKGVDIGKGTDVGSKKWSTVPSQRSVSSSSSSQFDIAHWPSDPSEMTAEDEQLLEAFYQSMKRGVSLILHKIGKNKLKRKNIRLWLEGPVIKWEIKGMVMSTKGSIQLGILKRILYGKHSAIFQREENKDVKEALCFTMVTNDYTIDFECASELERNAIARGFTILIKHLEDSEAS